MVAIGADAPDFTLPGTDGTDEGRRDYTLSEFRGQPVVLVFYPGDNTPVCTRQLNSYTAEIDEFEGVGAQVLALSPQDIASHDGFADKQGGFGFPSAGRHRQGGGRGLRHHRAHRLLPAIGVRGRRRRQGGVQPPGHRRADLPPHVRTGRRRRPPPEAG